MQKYKFSAVVLLTSLLALMAGCGGEGPMGNNAPQGRPDWMKKKSDSAQPAQAPQQQ
jgi:predicted small lipoprotein YifL